jgi:GMP synthase-like glutamine amidotransferase
MMILILKENKEYIKLYTNIIKSIDIECEYAVSMVEENRSSEKESSRSG